VVRLNRIAVYLAGNRVFDLVVGSILIVLLSPVMLAAAIAVKLSSPGPVLYIQTRVNRRGQPFRFLRFRTLRVSYDFDELAARGEATVTRVGRFLRRTRIEDLPQLFNVLLGDMSLIGPRPERPHYTG
jgi:lipopolysaccharide/colanic/teichoic acid biosynthesis glycosyltransferase